VRSDLSLRPTTGSKSCALSYHAEAHVSIQNAQAVVREFRELQARCETIIGVLAPEEKGVPRLVVAA
jgi:hypothetical protein